MSNPIILQASNLSFGYPERPLWQHLTWQIGAGISLVRGGDGCGKTSLLRLLAGELQARHGQLTINGISLQEQPEQYRQQLYYVDPHTTAFEKMTVMQYLASVQARFAGFDATLVPDLLAGLSLTPHVEKQLFMLSTGSKRKVYLAAAFAAGAAVTLLDDPLAALDLASIHFVCHTLNRYAAQSARAWILSCYEPPAQLCVVATLDLGD